MKVFVTGGTGFIGGFLVKRLVEQGHDVKVLVRKTSNLKYLKGLEINKVYGEISDTKSLKEATKDIEAVFHLAGLIHPVNVPDSKYYDVNVKGSADLFRSAFENNGKNLKHFIYCSSVTCYGIVEDESRPIKEDHPCYGQNIYGKTKYEGELALKKLSEKYGVPITILRPARVYGPRDMSWRPILKLMKKGLFLNIGSGKSTMQPVYVTDVADAFVDVLDNKKTFGKAYNIAGTEVINKKQFLSLLARLIGKRLPKLNIPFFMVKTAAILNEALFLPFGKDPFVSRKKLKFFLMSRKYDVSRAKRDFGYDPKVDFREGLKRTVAWYKKEGLI